MAPPRTRSARRHRHYRRTGPSSPTKSSRPSAFWSPCGTACGSPPRDPAEPAVPLLLILHPSDSDRQIRGGGFVVPGADYPGRKCVYSPEDGGGLFDLPIPCGRVVGAHEGGWLGVLSVINPFSSTPGGDASGLLLQVPLEFGVCKVVFSDAPTTSSISGFVLAAITGDRLSVALRRVSSPSPEKRLSMEKAAAVGPGTESAAPTAMSWRRRNPSSPTSPSATEEETSTRSAARRGSSSYSRSPSPSAPRRETETGSSAWRRRGRWGRSWTPARRKTTTTTKSGGPPTTPARYLVSLRGKPAVAALARWAPGRHGEPFFKVFELDTTGDGNGGCGWAEAKGLGGDHALFVGPACSRAAEVGGDMRRDAVYYSGYRRSGARRRGEEEEDGGGLKEEGIASVGYCIGNGALGAT
ncbi:uncharacterized protein LOC112270796 [Brachypodium distachyon]|uniref:uncharacterized protein LOC112270796 n=1 Tax=Brachypodium distachyon TaxID=15368 RepID=UPI000D0D7765|nr:uncharacterized protein LOC112270796 [Brachypodium distachyon]|eukprot:XP_024314780.1 uncharacterized protein LOC112270796 [Brachypodium distachyon]